MSAWSDEYIIIHLVRSCESAGRICRHAKGMRREAQFHTKRSWRAAKPADRASDPRSNDPRFNSDVLLIGVCRRAEEL